MGFRVWGFEASGFAGLKNHGGKGNQNTEVLIGTEFWRIVYNMMAKEGGPASDRNTGGAAHRGKDS